MEKNLNATLTVDPQGSLSWRLTAAELQWRYILESENVYCFKILITRCSIISEAFVYSLMTCYVKCAIFWSLLPYILAKNLYCTFLFPTCFFATLLFRFAVILNSETESKSEYRKDWSLSRYYCLCSPVDIKLVPRMQVNEGWKSTANIISVCRKHYSKNMVAGRKQCGPAAASQLHEMGAWKMSP